MVVNLSVSCDVLGDPIHYLESSIHHLWKGGESRKLLPPYRWETAVEVGTDAGRSASEGGGRGGDNHVGSCVGHGCRFFFLTQVKQKRKEGCAELGARPMLCTAHMTAHSVIHCTAPH